MVATGVDQVPGNFELVARLATHAGAPGHVAGIVHGHVHFESKEDLIAALAIESWRGRSTCFECFLSEENLNAGEKMIGVVLVDFLFSVDQPELFATEQLASTPSVIYSVSERRIREMEMLHETIMKRLSEAGREAIDDGAFQPWKDRKSQAEAMDRAVWTLMSGSSYIFLTENYLKQHSEWTCVIPDWLKTNCTAMFSGLGWNSKNPKKDVEKIAKYCLQKGRHHQLLTPSADTFK